MKIILSAIATKQLNAWTDFFGNEKEVLIL